MIPPTALITGAARRVGAAIARELARAWDHRCRIVITYRASDDHARRLADDLHAGGADVILEQIDLADLAAVEALTARLATSLGRLDVLVHNASTYIPTPLDTLAADDLLSAYRINAAAPVLLSRGLAPLLRASPLKSGGAIVAMCDIHALGEHGLPRPGFIGYGMSKAALAEMVRALARELAPHIRVNGVAPGVVAWPESGYESDEAMQQAYLSRVPLARPGTPEDAAGAVRWLALEAAYVTGEIIRLDGGRSLR